MTRFIGMSMHGVTALRVKNYYPENSQSVSLQVVKDDMTTEIDLYGMSEGEALRVVAALADAQTVIYDGRNNDMNLTDYLTTRGVFNKLEGK